MNLEKIQKMIEEECDEIKELLLLKNSKYGNSAIEPKNIFSKQTSCEQIKVRIDDKLSRINNLDINDPTYFTTVKDLIGYLILFRITNKISNNIDLNFEKEDLLDS